jgi:very-short-patch-repair endonuclease
MGSAIEKLSVVASRQRGLVTWAQLADVGLSRRKIRSLVEGSHLVRVRPRVYRLAGTEISWEQALLSAVLSIGDGALASHSAAARLWGFAYTPESAIEVTVGRERRAQARGIVLHRSRCFEDADRARRGGIPCTSFERALCDCSSMLSEFQLGRTLDDGLRRGVASIARLVECARRLESGPGRHMSAIRALLSTRHRDFIPAGSASERRVLDVLRKTSLPEPVQQYVVRVDGRRFELDYAWPERRIFVEYYGLAVHSLPSAVAYDSERLTLLTSAGWTPLVFTDSSADEEILERVSAVLNPREVGTLTYRIGA